MRYFEKQAISRNRILKNLDYIFNFDGSQQWGEREINKYISTAFDEVRPGAFKIKKEILNDIKTTVDPEHQTLGVKMVYSIANPRKYGPVFRHLDAKNYNSETFLAEDPYFKRMVANLGNGSQESVKKEFPKSRTRETLPPLGPVKPNREWDPTMLGFALGGGIPLVGGTAMYIKTKMDENK